MKIETDKNSINRRGFLRSIFTLGSLQTASSVEAKATPSFFWCDLVNGNVGFPTGLAVPAERPGSIAKLIAVICLVEDGFNTNHKYECTGTYRAPGAAPNDAVHCQIVHGQIDLVRAIGFSCNCFFAQATARLTARAYLKKAKQLGLASPVAGRRSGLFPSHEGDISGSSLPYVMGLAPDFKPNCLQLARLAAMIALGPEHKLPVLHSSENLDIVEREKPLTIAISASAHKFVTEGMRLAVTEGTAHKIDPQDKLKIAAKTGTVPHGNKFQSQVIGFFPFDKPRNAFCLFTPSGTSQDSAIPAARDILHSTTW